VKGNMKGLMGIILLLVITAVGCDVTTTEPVKVDKQKEMGVQEGTPVKEDVKEEQTVEDVKEEQTVEDVTIFKVGDTVAMGDLEFTINSVRFDEGSEYFKPDEGKKWLVADCTVTNNSEESTTISSMLMIRLFDSEYYSQEMSLFADTKGSLDGELGAGRTLRGEVAYEVDASETAWELIFEPNFFGFGQAIFNLDISDIQ